MLTPHQQAGAALAVAVPADDAPKPSGGWEDLWALACAAFYFRDEPRFADQVPPGAPDPADAEQVLAAPDLAEGVPRDGLRSGAESILIRLGFRQNLEGSHYEADASRLAALEQLRNASRQHFHARVSELRYESFATELGKAAAAGRRIRDAESGAYVETAEMAGAQRDALAEFVARFSTTVGLQPFITGLVRCLQEQQGKGADSVVAWTLDDAALVERGHEFAFEAVKLLLVHLRFLPKDLALEQRAVARTFVVDPQLSDRRIDRLVAVTPPFAKKLGKVALSGAFAVLPPEAGFSRTNVDGMLDAACPQDSLFYGVWSRCDLL